MDSNGKYGNGQQGLNESFLEHAEKFSISERNAHFSVEPSGEKEFDIYLMTGNNEKGSDKQ